MSPADVSALAGELRGAYASGQTVATLPSARDPGFDLDAAYAVEAELARLRRADGRKTVGWKVGYANKAVWRALKLDTLVWAHMYDDTVRFAAAGEAALAPGHAFALKIEPEIVFKLKAPLAGDASDPVTILESVEWLALGFEIIGCPFPDWHFQPADFVAAFGLHAALVVGPPMKIDPEDAERVAIELSRFTVRLFKDGQLVEEGSGRNVLRSPALCLAELATAMAHRAGVEPIQSGDLISSGTLTASHLLGSGHVWRAEADGIDAPSLTLRA